MQNCDEAADHESHAIEIGDLLGAKIEGAAQDAGKNEHPRHAEDILHTQDQQLIVGQPFINADVEDLFGRLFRVRHGLHGHFDFLLRWLQADNWEPYTV